jgi:hypothetical protein
LFMLSTTDKFRRRSSESEGPIAVRIQCPLPISVDNRNRPDIELREFVK